MDLLLTTDYAVQDEQEDIEVWHSAHFPLSAHAHTRTVLCCAVLPYCPGNSQQYHSTWKLVSASCACHKVIDSIITDCCYALLEQHTNLSL